MVINVSLEFKFPKSHLMYMCYPQLYPILLCSSNFAHILLINFFYVHHLSLYIDLSMLGNVIHVKHP